MLRRILLLKIVLLAAIQLMVADAAWGGIVLRVDSLAGDVDFGGMASAVQTAGLIDRDEKVQPDVVQGHVAEGESFAPVANSVTARNSSIDASMIDGIMHEADNSNQSLIGEGRELLVTGPAGELLRPPRTASRA